MLAFLSFITNCKKITTWKPGSVSFLTPTPAWAYISSIERLLFMYKKEERVTEEK